MIKLFLIISYFATMAELSEIERYMINRVKEKRIKAGLTQAVLSVAMDLSPSFVGNVESGNSAHKYNVNHINKLAIIFECSVRDFFPDQPFSDKR